jgi:hypothetical protein
MARVSNNVSQLSQKLLEVRRPPSALSPSRGGGVMETPPTARSAVGMRR